MYQPIGTLSGVENLLNLVMADNPGLEATLDQLTFPNPNTLVEDEGETVLTVVAVEDQGFSGSIGLRYDRLDLANGFTGDEVGYFISADPTGEDVEDWLSTVHDIVFYNTPLGTTPTVALIGDLPSDAGEEVTKVHLKANSSTDLHSYIYLPGTESVEFTLSRVDLSNARIKSGTTSPSYDNLRLTSDGQVRLTASPTP